MWTQLKARHRANELPPVLIAFSIFFFSAFVSFGQNFAPASAPAQNWVSITSSADGAKLAAVGCYGGLYLSTNSGATWSPALTAAIGPQPSRPWNSLAPSPDATKPAAVAN